ncbi:uncharacterized protein LOC142352843 [Convolutriloba macropyga]|uniref:uncharacterized protein LOC142352843 n=1 Tax=Convolutriloba macropyga TaxID=536237 RepID=UPI003F521505
MSQALVVDQDRTDQHGVVVYRVEAKDRERATSEALANQPPGTFYIRLSSIKNCLVVQFVKDNNEVDRRLLEIVPNSEPVRYRVNVAKNCTHPSIRHLIDHYSKNPITQSNAFARAADLPADYVPNTLVQYLIKPEIVKFTHHVSRNQSCSDLAILESLPCEENDLVAVVRDTAGWLYAINKRNGMYGRLQNDVAQEPSDSLNVAEDLPDLLYSPPGYSPSLRFPCEAVALVDYAVPYSDDTTIMFKRGDTLCVKGKSKGMLLGYVKNDDDDDNQPEETKDRHFPLFSVRFLSQNTNVQM